MEEQAGLWELSTKTRLDSSSSTPFESAVCSPRSSTDRAASCHYSANSPMYPVSVAFDIRSLPCTGMGFVVPSSDKCFHSQLAEPASDDFDFSARFSEADQPWSPAPMSSADELFSNGQIRPLWDNYEDLVHLYPAYTKPSDDDDHFDFRSSADYKFTTCSAPHSPASARNKPQRYVGYSDCGPSHNEGFVRSHGTVSQECKEDATWNGDEQRNKTTPQKSRGNSGQGDDEIIAKQQAIMAKVEESRGRRTGGNKEGGVRRTRSLSPLRVFHMDDELPGQSFETDQSFQSAKGNVSDEQEEEQGIEISSRKGPRLTLKDLLHASEQAERRNSHRTPGAKEEKKADVETKMKERNTLWFKSSPKHASDNHRRKGSDHSTQYHSKHHQATMSPHSLHYASQRVRTEQMRQQTFLPYRHGLLGCLGFSSKSYRSVAGIRTFHSKSHGGKTKHWE